ncbi:MAG: tetratricopeptide repeat protein [Myxococcota bacterium]|nr:tetratricopeptide repeat protein [Myxococcota bacterium]
MRGSSPPVGRAGLPRLIASGRLDEAAAVVRRLARCGTPSWEVLLWAGRIHERAGRLAEAERSFRRAWVPNPSAPLPLVELSRFLESAGRPDEAQAVLREGAAAVARDLPGLLAGLVTRGPRGGLDDRLRALFEFRPFRRAFLAEVGDRAGDLERLTAALRAVLDVDSARGDVRTLLANILLARGRTAAAERLAAEAFAVDSTGADTSRIELVLALIERGRFGGRLERALLTSARNARPPDKILVEWPQVFSALMCARRYRTAFRLGEAMLDRLGQFESPQPLLWPWWRRVGRAVNEQRFLAAELRRIRQAARAGAYAHWFAYYRAVLLSCLARPAAAAAEYARIERLDPVRYSWMRQAFVVVSLELLDLRGTVAICRTILKHCPRHWWVRCRMAEAHLALGARAAGLREFARAEATTDANARREVLTWHGEVLLWLGEYHAALVKLDQAIALGATTFTYGWRGAARLKLGDLERAVEDLDRAVALDAKDVEALVWRGEAFRLLGRHDEARRDLDAFIADHPGCCWGHFNRGLVRSALGDEEGMADDYARVPARVTSFVQRSMGLPDDRVPGRAVMRRVMAAGLEMGRGIRRWEDYVNMIWGLPPPVGRS